MKVGIVVHDVIVQVVYFCLFVGKKLSIRQISNDAGMDPHDIAATLQMMNLLRQSKSVLIIIIIIIITIAWLLLLIILK